MKRLIFTATLLVAVCLPAVAAAQPPTPRHAGVYEYLRHHVIREHGASAAGRDMLMDGRSDGHPVTDAGIVDSIHVYWRILWPPRIRRATLTRYSTTGSTVVTQSVGSVTPSSYERCIINAESGGRPNAVNGQYSGIGQWSVTQWQADGGGRYSSTPLGASYSQQEIILRGEGRAGMGQQQGRYDPCGP